MAEKIKVSPNVCSYADEDHKQLIVEMELPGVEKKNIELKMHEDSFYINAPREDIVYVGSYATCCPIDYPKAKAEYKNGLLKIEVPFKDPHSDTVEVPVE